MVAEVSFPPKPLDPNWGITDRTAWLLDLSRPTYWVDLAGTPPPH